VLNSQYVSNLFPIKQKTLEKSRVLVAGNIEISNQLISDLLEFVDVAEELININVIKSQESLVD
jgi:hypothetical protein